MRNGCLPSIVILIASVLGLLMWMDSAHADPAAVGNQPAASQPADASHVSDVAESTSQPADAAATQPADTVVAVNQLMDEMGLTTDSLTRYVGWPYPDEGTRALITGNLLTSDGSALPKDAMVLVYGFSGGMQLCQGMTVGADGAFSLQHYPGPVWVSTKASGWAPALIGPFLLSDDKPLDNVQIVLSAGKSMGLRVTDPAGKPVANANVKISRRLIRFTDTYIEAKTGPNGAYPLVDLPDKPLMMEISAPGYLTWSRIIDASDAQEINTILAPQVRLTGTLVSQRDGKPVAGAKLYLTEAGRDFRRELENAQYQKISFSDSDKDGHFELTISDLKDPILTAITPDGGILSVAVNGRKEIALQMPEPLTVRGRLTGNLNLLDISAEGTANLGYENPTVVYGRPSMPHDSIEHHNAVASRVEGGMVFEITRLYPGKVTLSLSHWSKEIMIDKSITDLEISLPPEPVLPGDVASADEDGHDVPPSDQAGDNVVPVTSEVTFKFIPPPGVEKIIGQVPILGLGSRTVTNLEIKNNQIQCIAEAGRNVGTTFSYLPGVTAPYSDFHMPPAGQSQVREVHLKPVGAIRCKVVDDNGEPVYGFTPGRLPIIGQSQDLHINTQFIRSATNAGEYFVSALPLDQPISFYLEPYYYGTLWPMVAMSQPVTLTSEQPVLDVDLVIRNGTTLKIHLQDVDGKPVAGQWVIFKLALNKNLSMGLYGQRTDGHGDIVASHLDLLAGDGWTAAIRDIPGMQQVDVPLTPGMTDLTIQLKPGLHARGTVVDAASGRPLVNVPVNASALAGSAAIIVCTNSRGEFDFDCLSEGQYRLGILGVIPADAEGNDPAQWPTITAGQDATISMRVKPDGHQAHPYLMGDAPAKPLSGN